MKSALFVREAGLTAFLSTMRSFSFSTFKGEVFIGFSGLRAGFDGLYTRGFGTGGFSWPPPVLAAALFSGVTDGFGAYVGGRRISSLSTDEDACIVLRGKLAVCCAGFGALTVLCGAIGAFTVLCGAIGAFTVLFGGVGTFTVLFGGVGAFTFVLAGGLT